MIKIREVGTGITRHQQIICEGLGPNDRAAYEREIEALGGYVHPCDLPAWLEKYEAELARLADIMRLPNRGNAMVIFDPDNRSVWRYERDREADQVIGETQSGEHAQLAMFYLADKSARGRGWGYQSTRWYMGSLMRLAHLCRQALESGATLELAGRCLELGALDREWTLKCSGQKRLREFERRCVAGTDEGNKTLKRKADFWKSIAREIVNRHPDIDVHKPRDAAQRILAKWPKDKCKPPAKDYLRKHVRKLAKP